MVDEPEPIAYTALRPGTPVHTHEGREFGIVQAVLVVEDMDLFDGIVVTTPAGKRFVDADHVGQIFTTYVLTRLSAEQAEQLPLPDRDQFQRITPATGVGASLTGKLARMLGRRRR
jgi:hypothetical protein